VQDYLWPDVYIFNDKYDCDGLEDDSDGKENRDDTNQDLQPTIGLVIRAYDNTMN